MTYSRLHLVSAHRFFVDYLFSGILLIALGWSLLIGLTTMSNLMPHISDRQVQLWWLVGSLHLVYATVAIVTLFFRDLSCTTLAALTPGWQRANFLLWSIWIALFVMTPFIASGMWAQLSGETWQVSSLAWLVVAASAGIVVAACMPSTGSFWNGVAGALTLGLLIEGGTWSLWISKKFLFVWHLIVELAKYPWWLALLSATSAGVAFTCISRPQTRPVKKRGLMDGMLKVIRLRDWTSRLACTRRWPLLGGVGQLL
jgi:hypothetical protein